MIRWCVAVIVFCFSWSVGFGQDTTEQRKADSLRQQIDSLQLPGKKNLDSPQRVSKNVSAAGTAVQQKVNHVLDSVNPNQKLTNYQNRIDSTSVSLLIG